MSAQLSINMPIISTRAKYDTLLPLFTNCANQVEKDLISKLNKDLFTSNSKNSSFPVYMKPKADALLTQNSNKQECIPTPMSSPPRTPISLELGSPLRSDMITPPPEADAKQEIMTIASKVPLFRRRKTNYINKDVASSDKGPVVMKLCNINYTTPMASPASTHVPIPVNITIPSTKQRKFRCKTCSMAFTTSGHLSRHNKIHTGERKFTCPLDGCDQKFSRHDNCLQHYRTHLKKAQKNKK